MAYPMVAIASGRQGQTSLNVIHPKATVRMVAATHSVVYIVQEDGTVVSLSPRVSRLPFTTKVSWRQVPHLKREGDVLECRGPPVPPP